MNIKLIIRLLQLFSSTAFVIILFSLIFAQTKYYNSSNDGITPKEITKEVYNLLNDNESFNKTLLKKRVPNYPFGFLFGFGYLTLMLFLPIKSTGKVDQNKHKRFPKKDRKGLFNDPRDGKVYKTIKIGKQVWMAENLAYKPSKGNYWAYDNNQSNVARYGYLYDWHTALNASPMGWHLPSDEEWTILIDYLGGEKKAGGKLKEAGTTHWFDPNEGANNKTGFTALPSGGRDDDGKYGYAGSNGVWWGATESAANNAWGRLMAYHESHVRRYSYSKEVGWAVRCLRD
jgi:uncharacterized protein (TIGR02145 family)